MENRINVAELLKGCPRGMELDCTLFDDITFEEATNNGIYIRMNNGELFMLSKKGSCIEFGISKCVIFPKGKTTWEGFVPPCKFKDGDIIFTHANCLQVGLGNTWISIFQENRNGGVATYVDYAEDGDFYYDYIDESKGLLCMNEDILRQRFATEEEKQKLFDAIKAKGYKWNAENKTLEKLIVPKFKVGDRIRGKISKDELVVGMIDEYYYYNKELERYAIENQDCYELVPNKFDITTLKAFDKVLTRATNEDTWVCNIYSHKLSDYFVVLNAELSNQCIPYNDDTKHLLGTTNDCDEYYKTW